MVAITRQTVLKIIKFGGVGGLAFLVDAGFTTAFVHYGLDAFSARLIAIAIAMLVAWRLNRAITFGASDTSQTSEGLRYFLVAIAAAMVNYTAYAALVLMWSALWPFLAVAISTCISMVVSFFGFSRFTFKSMPKSGA